MALINRDFLFYFRKRLVGQSRCVIGLTGPESEMKVRQIRSPTRGNYTHNACAVYTLDDFKREEKTF